MALPFTLDLGRLLFTVTSFSVNVVSLKLVNFFSVYASAADVIIIIIAGIIIILAFIFS